MNRHQFHGVGRFIDLSFAFAAANRFKLLDVPDEVANQMSARVFEASGKSKQSLHIGESLCAVKIGCDHGLILRLFDRKPKQFLDGRMMTTRNDATDEV